jgi:hypothetical protein
MAKKKKGRPPGSGKIVRAAETVGGTLGRVMAKVDTWMTQRQEIAGELRAAVDKTLSAESPIPWRRAKPARVTTTARARKTRMISAGARRSISEPRKRRGAKEKAGKTKGTRKAKKATG